MRMLLTSWNLVVQRGRREEMTALAEEARKHLAKQSVRGWRSRGRSKESLVQMAIEELGMSRAEASRERVGQLQFLLKTRRAETNLGEAIDARASLPRGLSKMKKAELQEEMLARGLDIHQMNGQDKVREAMIRDITLHVEMVSDRAMSVASATVFQSIFDVPEHAPTTLLEMRKQCLRRAQWKSSKIQ